MFTLSTSGATLTRNSSYVQNPGFPSPYMGGTGVTYTVNKVSSGENAETLVNQQNLKRMSFQMSAT